MQMRRGIFAISLALMAAIGLCTMAQGQGTVVVAVPAQAGAVQGTTANSDAFIWQLLTQFAAPASSKSPKPVLFETWASDEETFSTNPHWPQPNRPLRLHTSALDVAKVH